MPNTWVSIIFLLSFPIPLQSVRPFTLRNMSINVYGVYDDNEVIYPLRVSSILVPGRHVDLLLFGRDGVQHYTIIIDFSRLVGRQLRNHGHTVHCCRRCLHAYTRLLPCTKNEISRGPTLSIHQYPETTDSTVTGW